MLKLARKKKNQKKVKTRDYDKHFKQKDIQRWLEADDSEVVILEESNEFYVVRSLVLVFW